VALVQYGIPAGAKPEHFTTMLQRLETLHGARNRGDGVMLSEYLSTHPAIQERIRVFGKD
jgi:Zn-dependent protease with chaperone function